MTTPDYISFPPASISDEPLRIPLLWNDAAGLALAKPPGLPAFQDSRVGGGPRSILTEINSRAEAGVPQFERLARGPLFALNMLEREASGVLLYAKGKEARDVLKNAMGSSQFSFRYRFLTAGNSEKDEIFCDLPLAVHREKPLALVSNQTGKKTVTTFRRLEVFAHGSLWESESVYDRYHQVRLHAAEVGLPVLGDELYCKARRSLAVKPSPELAALLAGHPLFLHLFALRFPVNEAWIDLEAKYARGFQMGLKKLVR